MNPRESRRMLTLSLPEPVYEGRGPKRTRTWNEALICKTGWVFRPVGPIRYELARSRLLSVTDTQCIMPHTYCTLSLRVCLFLPRTLFRSLVTRSFIMSSFKLYNAIKIVMTYQETGAKQGNSVKSRRAYVKSGESIGSGESIES